LKLRTNSLGQPIGPEVAIRDVYASPRVESLQGKYVRLERLKESHGEDLFNAFAADVDGLGWTYLPYGPFANLEEFKEWLLPFSKSQDPWMYALVDKASDQALGVASYLRIKPESASAEVGHIHFSMSLKKTRASTEAIFLMADHVFSLGYRRFEWKCDALNEDSKRAAARFGFVYEGTFRQATVYKNRNRDTAWFAVIDRDWPAIKKAYVNWLSKDNFDALGQQRTALQTLAD